MLAFRSVPSPQFSCMKPSSKQKANLSIASYCAVACSRLADHKRCCDNPSISMGDPQHLLSLQVDKNPGTAPVPALIQAYNSQITNNVATSQGGGINAATSDGIFLINTELSGNFGKSLAHLPCFACASRCCTLLLRATNDMDCSILSQRLYSRTHIRELCLLRPQALVTHMQTCHQSPAP